MPITYDITKDKLYLRGIKAGEEKTKAMQRTVVERMLATKQLTIDQIAEIADVSINFVQEVQRSME